MTYFKIGEKDYSKYVSSLKVQKTANYNSQTNAAGHTVVDYINSKRDIEVGFIHMDSLAILALQADIENINVSISFRNPVTNSLEENVSCLLSGNTMDYYTIQDNRVMFKPFTLKFSEL